MRTAIKIDRNHDQTYEYQAPSTLPLGIGHTSTLTQSSFYLLCMKLSCMIEQISYWCKATARSRRSTYTATVVKYFHHCTVRHWRGPKIRRPCCKFFIVTNTALRTKTRRFVLEFLSISRPVSQFQRIVETRCFRWNFSLYMFPYTAHGNQNVKNNTVNFSGMDLIKW